MGLIGRSKWYRLDEWPFVLHSPRTSPSNGFYANGVTFHSPGSPRSGEPWVTGPPLGRNPNGVLQMRAGCVTFVCPFRIRHERLAVVQPRWGKRGRMRTTTQGTRLCREPWVTGPPRGRNPNGVLQMRAACVTFVCPTWIHHERWAIVQPRWGKRIGTRNVNPGYAALP